VVAPVTRDDSAAVDVAPIATPCPPGSEWQLRDLVNAFRTQHGAWELPLSAELMQKAQQWSDSMATSGVLAHSPLAEGVSPGYSAVAENVALDVSAAAAEVFFEQSPVHRANLLGAATEMGLGVSRDEHGRVWVAQVFAQRSVPTPPYRGPANSSAYHPIVPIVAFRQAVAIDSSASFQVTGSGGVPAGSTAVMATITATDSVDLGRVQVLLPDSDIGETSALEFGSSGASISTIVPLDGEGRLTLHSSVAVQLAVTVSGAFLPAGGPTATGRFVPVDAARLATLSVDADVPLSLSVTGRAGVPTSGVLAVVLGVHAADGSVATVDGTPAAGLVIAPVDADGRVVIADAVSTEVTVDVAGWFTDALAPASTSGLFVPVTPGRFLDTRAGVEAVAGGRHVDVPGRHGVPACPRAVAAALTIVPATSGGIAQVGPMREFAPGLVPTVVAERPTIPVSGAALVATGEGSDLGVYTSVPAEVMVDLVGWFL
jgi:hypothetical protein